jgi:hypothetical protein
MIAAHRHECVYGEAAEEYRVLGSSARKPTLSRNAFGPKRNPHSPLRAQQGRIFARSVTLSSALATKGALRTQGIGTTEITEENSSISWTQAIHGWLTFSARPLAGSPDFAWIGNIIDAVISKLLR